MILLQRPSKPFSMISHHGRIFIYLTIATFIFLYMYIWYTDNTNSDFLKIEILYVNNSTDLKNVETIIAYVEADVGTQSAAGQTNVGKDYNEKILGLIGTSGILESAQKENVSLLIDTPGCKIPNFDPFDPTLKNLIHIDDALVCPGKPLFMKPEPHGSISLDEYILKTHYGIDKDNLTCHYQHIFRDHIGPWPDREQYIGYSNSTRLYFGKPLKEDHVKVTCELGIGSNLTFEHFFPLVYLKDHVEEERSKLSPPQHGLNVILVGVDSVSRLNSMRHLTRTRAFLDDKMSAFEMKAYNKVADNTFPNLVPLLMGDFVENLWTEQQMKKEFVFDDSEFLWTAYAKRGYRTFYAEDMPMFGTFTYLKKGFFNQPTDYYFRPLALAYQNSSIINDNEICLNSQLETDLMYGYLTDFVRTMESRPYFAFAMASTITHDYLNNAAYADAPTLRLVEDLWNGGALNKSVLVLFSDHGLRFGDIRNTYIGKIEERLPFMYIHFPKWFLDQNPVFAKNLETNQRRLMTFFDINATLKHLLNLGCSSPPCDIGKTLGQSLLQEISEHRTCKDANILAHWCTCQSYQELPTDDDDVRTTSQALVDSINSRLEPFQTVCAHLELDDIMDARLGLVNEQILTFRSQEDAIFNASVHFGEKVDNVKDYLLTVRTVPGNGTFEGTVRLLTDLNQTEVLGISRINMYGNQSHCINNQKFKLFCYCK